MRPNLRSASHNIHFRPPVIHFNTIEILFPHKVKSFALQEINFCPPVTISSLKAIPFVVKEINFLLQVTGFALPVMNFLFKVASFAFTVKNLQLTDGRK